MEFLYSYAAWQRERQLGAVGRIVYNGSQRPGDDINDDLLHGQNARGWDDRVLNNVTWYVLSSAAVGRSQEQ